MLGGRVVQHQDLGLGELGIDERQCHAVKGQVPGRKPRVLPRVGHQDDLADCEVLPVVIARTPPALPWRCRLVGIALEPAAYRVVVELFTPQQPGERLALDEPLVLAQVRCRDGVIELVGLTFAVGEHRVGVAGRVRGIGGREMHCDR